MFGGLETSIETWEAIGMVLGVVAAAVGFLIVAFAALALIALVIPVALIAAFLAVGAVIVWLISKLVKFVFFIGDGISTAVKSAFQFVKGFFGALAAFFGSLGPTMTDVGSGLVDAMLVGIKAAWSRLKDFFKSGVQGLRDMLPGSDAKIGPLSDLTASGSALVTTFAGGAQAALPELNTTVGDLAQGSRDNLLPSVDGQPLPARGGAGAPASGALTTAGGAGGGTTIINFEAITFQAKNTSPEEADRFVELVMSRMQDRLDNETEATFG